jgi:hypothetical protein
VIIILIEAPAANPKNKVFTFEASLSSARKVANAPTKKVYN